MSQYKDANPTIVINGKKLVMVGDVSGKSCAVQSFVEDEFCTPFTTICYDTFVTDIEANGQLLEVDIWDVSSGSGFKSVRTQAYQNVDAFLIFFNVYRRTSYDHVKTVWLPEVKKYCPDVPYVLVGTCFRPEVRFGPAKSFFSDEKIGIEEGEALAEEIGARCYVECLSDRKYNLEKIFVEAVAASLDRNK